MKMVESTLLRTKPAINTDAKGAFLGIALGLGLIMLSLGLGFILARTLFGERPFTFDIVAILPHLDTGLFLLVIFAIPVLILSTGVWCVFNVVLGFISRYNWLRNAHTAQALVIDRNVRVNEESDYYGTVTTVYEYELELKYSPSESTTTQVEQTIWALVEKSIFDKYKHCDTACIRYSMTDPSIFLIKGE